MGDIMRRKFTLTILAGLIYWLLVRFYIKISSILFDKLLLTEYFSEGVFILDVLPFIYGLLLLLVVKEIKFINAIYYTPAIVIFIVIDVIQKLVIYSDMAQYYPDLNTDQWIFLSIEIGVKHQLFLFFVGSLLAIKINKTRLKGCTGALRK